jgi:predicted regulator of Ras-like GTPase activity (Roadblock/LC7/MglB family)
MDLTSPQEAALQQLSAVPGVVGSLIFDATGKVQAAAFPARYDAWALTRLGAQLAADGFFQEWMAGDEGLLTLRFVDGHVALRSLGGAFALVFSSVQANERLLGMSLAQLARRLRPSAPPPARPPADPPPPLLHRPAAPQPKAVATAAAPPPPPAAAKAERGPLDRLEDLARAELGAHAAQALTILAAAGPQARDQLRAVSEVERLVRLFISKKKAEDLARRMRQLLQE